MVAKCIMVQGTMSSAGKSFLAAGLCRIFREDGLRVAPFGSQNIISKTRILAECKSVFQKFCDRFRMAHNLPGRGIQ